MRQLIFQDCYAKYQASFYLWQIGPVLKYFQAPKYYDQDCRPMITGKNFLKHINYLELLPMVNSYKTKKQHIFNDLL